MNLLKKNSESDFNNKVILIRPFYLDLFCVIVLFCVNPVTFFINLSPGVFPPDFFSYAAMGRDLFHKGLLYIPSWEHVDSCLILPPLYPFLIAVGSIFTSEAFALAEIISSISMLLFSFLSFIYLRYAANRLIALVSAVLIQVNYFYFLIGMMPLTESIFVLTIGLSLLLAFLLFRDSDKKQKSLSILLGISCCLVFFSRQVGGFIFVFIALLFFIRFFTVSVKSRKVLFYNFLFYVCGLLLLMVPYTSILYLQTGHHPLKQRFKKHEYVVKVSDPQILKLKRQETKLPEQLKEIIESQPDAGYNKVYAKRRLMRKLLPDSSEMYGYISAAGNLSKGAEKNESFSLKKIRSYFNRFYKNFLHLKDVLGAFTAVLLIISYALLFAVKGEGEKFKRYILPSFILAYLLVISWFTDRIARYAYILFPFCIMFISIEMYNCFKLLKRILKKELFGFMFLAVLFPLILVSTPRYFTELPLNKKVAGTDKEYGRFKKIVKGVPVFSMFAFESYLIGSPYRFLPNDSLEKVAAYGKKTGVRWILIFHSRSSVNELKYYTNLNWYTDRMLENNHPGVVKLRHFSEDGSMALFEIL